MMFEFVKRSLFRLAWKRREKAIRLIDETWGRDVHLIECRLCADLQEMWKTNDDHIHLSLTHYVFKHTYCNWMRLEWGEMRDYLKFVSSTIKSFPIDWFLQQSAELKNETWNLCKVKMITTTKCGIAYK
jgi:hypothetical protein